MGSGSSVAPEIHEPEKKEEISPPPKPKERDSFAEGLDKLSWAHVRFNRPAFRRWVQLEAFFTKPGYMPYATHLLDALSEGPEFLPVSELVALFSKWDDISFFGLLRNLDPSFCRQDNVDYKNDQGDVLDEKASPPESLDRKASPKLQRGANGESTTPTENIAGTGSDIKKEEVERKSGHGASDDSNEILTKCRKEFGELLKYVLLLRERKRVEETYTNCHLIFDPSKFLGQSIDEINEDIFHERGVYGEIPETYTELKSKYHDLVLISRACYNSEQKMQDELRILYQRYEAEKDEIKRKCEIDFEGKLQQIDERYMEKLQRRDAALVKLVEKYAKTKRKYKKIENQFLHSNHQLGHCVNDGSNAALQAPNLTESQDSIKVDSIIRESGVRENAIYESVVAKSIDGMDDEKEMLIQNLQKQIKDLKARITERVEINAKTIQALNTPTISVMPKSTKMLSPTRFSLEPITEHDEAKVQLSTASMAAPTGTGATGSGSIENAEESRPKSIRTYSLVSTDSAVGAKMSKAAVDQARPKAVDGSVDVDDIVNITTKSSNEEIATVKEADQVILRSREIIQRSDMEKLETIKALQKERMQDKIAHDKELNALRSEKNLAEEQVLRMSRKLKEKGHSRFITEVKNTYERKSFITKYKRSWPDTVCMLLGHESKQARFYKATARWRLLCLRSKSLKITSLENRAERMRDMMKKIQQDSNSIALEKERMEHQEYVEKRELAINAMWEQKVKNLQKELHTRAPKSSELLKSKMKEFERDKQILKMALEKAKQDCKRLEEIHQRQAKKSEVQNSEMNKIIAQLEKKIEGYELKLNKSSVSVAVHENVQSNLRELQVERDHLKTRLKTFGRQLTEANKKWRKDRLLRIRYFNMIEDLKGKIRVYCRLRPMSSTEKVRGDGNCTSITDRFTIKVKTNNKREPVMSFVFDEVYGPGCSQERVFQNTCHLIQSTFDGYNVCVFAYGQTGTGKTYTMFGTNDAPGIAQRAIEKVYQLTKEARKLGRVQVTCYMVELYKSKLLDLLSENHNTKLKIGKDHQGVVEVKGAMIKEAPSKLDMLEILQQGMENRKTSSTCMNYGSSRSHLILSIMIRRFKGKDVFPAFGKLSLIDLAGCERASNTKATAEQLKEAQSINQSLSALGNVIAALSSGSKHVPYRSHVLTNLMSDSIGGNAKTLMFVNIGPSNFNIDDTINALNYASRVKTIKNSSKKNVDLKSKDDEIAKLKRQLQWERSRF